MYSYHVFLLPLAVVAIVAAHILLVRKHGIVPPFTQADSPEAQTWLLEPTPVPALTLAPASTPEHRPEPVSGSVSAQSPAPTLTSGHGPVPHAPPAQRTA